MGICLLGEMTLIPEFLVCPAVSQLHMAWAGDSSGMSCGAADVPRVATALFAGSVSLCLAVWPAASELPDLFVFNNTL